MELVMPAFRMVAIGECMIELSADCAGGWRLNHAGDTFNTLVYCRRLGAEVAYLTALGADPFSTEMLAEWRAEGIGTDLVLSDTNRQPGLYAIRTDAAGERSFFYWRGESAARHLFDQPGVDGALEQAAKADLLYVSGITLSLFGEEGRTRLREVAKAVRRRGGQVAFDPNYRPAGWADPERARAACQAFAPFVTIALPTFDDEHALWGDEAPQQSLERWSAHGAEVVVKLGPAGALVQDDAPRTVLVPETLAPVDTTGAGDAFNAGYLMARRKGCDRAQAALAGHRLAGRVVQERGAIIAVSRTPTLAELLDPQAKRVA